MKEGQPTSYKMKPNQVRHAENLAIFDGGFWHGTYYENGVARLPKKAEQPKTSTEVVIFEGIPHK